MLGSRPARTRVALAASLALAAGLAAGCSSGTPTAAPHRTSHPVGPTLLTVSVYGPPPVITAYATIAANFTHEHPTTQVNIRPYPNAAAAAAARADEATTGSSPDIFLSPVEALPGLTAQKAIRRVDQLLGERNVDFGDGIQRYALEAFSSANALQCMPVDVSPLVVYYNTDLINLAKLTPPNQAPITAEGGWTMDEFAAAALMAHGRGIRGVDIAPTLAQLAPFIYSGGGDIVDNDQAPTTLTLADGGNEASIERLLELVRNPLATFNDKQLAKVPALQRFKEGKLGMILGYRDLTPVLRAAPKLHFDVMPLPKLNSRATTGESAGLCLSAHSEHVNRAADFLAYAVSDQSGSILAQTGFTVPTDVDVLHTDAFVQAGQMPANASVFDDNVRYIRSLPMVAQWDAVDRAAQPELTRLFYDALIEPLDQRMKAIDALSVPIFTPPTPTPTPTSTP